MKYTGHKKGNEKKKCMSYDSRSEESLTRWRLGSMSKIAQKIDIEMEHVYKQGRKKKQRRIKKKINEQNKMKK